LLYPGAYSTTKADDDKTPGEERTPTTEPDNVVALPGVMLLPKMMQGIAVRILELLESPNSATTSVDDRTSICVKLLLKLPDPSVCGVPRLMLVPETVPTTIVPPLWVMTKLVLLRA
jgi:hypothetical protein